MNITIRQISIGILVKLVIKSAAPFAKVAETRMPVSTIRTARNLSVFFPKYFETILGIVNPLSLMDMNPEKKS